MVFKEEGKKFIIYFTHFIWVIFNCPSRLPGKICGTVVGFKQNFLKFLEIQNKIPLFLSDLCATTTETRQKDINQTYFDSKVIENEGKIKKYMEFSTPSTSTNCLG